MFHIHFSQTAHIQASDISDEKHTGKVLLIVLLLGATVLLIPQFALAVTPHYVTNPASCPSEDTQFLGQRCPAGTPNICGVNSSDIPQCYDNSTITPPTGTGTSNTQYTASLGGGYIIDCFAKPLDSAAPFCDNNGNALCNRDATCYSTQFRDTSCTGGSFGAYTCGSCRSGYQDCNTATTVCEVVTGVTNYDNNGAGPTEDNTNYAASCAAACDSGYLDCNTDLGTGGNGCEIQIGGACGGGSSNAIYGSSCSGGSGSCACSTGYFDCDASGPGAGTGCEVQGGSACTTTEGAAGTYSGCTCVPTKSYFETGTNSSYATQDPLLDGTNLGTGALIEMNNSSGPVFKVFNSGALQFGNFLEGTGTGAGTLRWTGLDFQGFDGTNWVSFTGPTESESDDRYVNISGDTMTGSLTIGNGSQLSISGAVLTEGNLTLNHNNSAADVVLTFGNDLIPETLTFSDTSNRFEFSDDVHVEDTLTASGALHVEGTTTLGSTVTLGGVSYTFPGSDGPNSGAVLKTNSAGTLTWGLIEASSLAERTKTMVVLLKGATIVGDGTDNAMNVFAATETGATSNIHHYVRAQTGSGQLQDVDIRVKVQLPQDFVNFTSATNDLRFSYRTLSSSSSVNKIDILVEDDDGDDAFTASNGQGLVNTSWTDYTDEFDGPSFDPLAGEYIYITIKAYTTSSGMAYPGEIVLTYSAQ